MEGGEGEEMDDLVILIVVHCVSFTDHDVHVVEEHCIKE